MSDSLAPRPFALGLAVYTIRDLVARDAADTLRQVDKAAATAKVHGLALISSPS